MAEKDFQITNGTVVKPISSDQKISLVSIQRKIQTLHAETANSGFLQQLLNEAGQLIGVSDKEAGSKIGEYSNDLNFYIDGGTDDLVKFFRCKAETLTIIAKQVA